MDQNELQSIKDMYINTLKKLQECYGSTDKIVNIPISKAGFIQGKIVNSLQITACISSEFSLTTDLQGCEIMIKKKLEGNP